MGKRELEDRTNAELVDDYNSLPPIKQFHAREEMRRRLRYVSDSDFLSAFCLAFGLARGTAR